MFEYYGKYDRVPLVETHSRIDDVVETPLRLTLTEIGVCFMVFIIVFGWAPGYYSLSAFIIAPITGFLLFKYRKTYPKFTWSHFLWTIGFLDAKKIRYDIPCIFFPKRNPGVLNFIKNVIRKRNRAIVYKD